MYIAVCDDQAEELSALTALLDQWQAERHFPLRYHTFRSAAGMLDAAQRERFSLYLLDVMMPGIDGMDAAREIRTFDDAADIVFLTSSPGFAYESYGVRALEYLLKPISGGLLFPVLDKLMLREQRPQDGLTLKAGATLVRVPFSQLSYVEVNGKHLYFHLADGTVREVAGSLKDVEPLLRARKGTALFADDPRGGERRGSGAAAAKARHRLERCRAEEKKVERLRRALRLFQSNDGGLAAKPPHAGIDVAAQ